MTNTALLCALLAGATATVALLARLRAPLGGHAIPFVELRGRQHALQLGVQVFLHGLQLAAACAAPLQGGVVGVLVADRAQLLRFLLQDRAQLSLLLGRQLQALLGLRDALLGAGGTVVEGEVKAIRDRLRERLDDARLKIGDLHHESIERARRAARDTDEYVHEHPWQAVGVGALFGLLLGVLIARR